jgi:hypothetical protein
MTQWRSSSTTRNLGTHLVLLVLAFGCSWTRFDDILDNSPIQALKSPGDLGTVGQSVAAMRGKSSTLAFATGDQGYAIYEFGKTDLSSADAVDRGVCRPQDNCWLSSSVAAVSQNIAAVATRCFAFGIETKPDESPRAVLYCGGNVVLGIGLPEPAPAEITALKPKSTAPEIRFSSGPRLAPDLLVASVPASGAVWFYPTDSSTPVGVPKPTTAGKSFGRSSAVAGAATTRFVIVGEPDAANLYVMRTDGTLPPDSALCISGATNFSVAMAVGHFTAADSEDLAVASDSEVVVLPALDSLPLSADLSAPCVALTELGIARTLGCQKLNAGNSCSGLLANVALAAADLDGDGRDELLVGAPSASTRGNDAAGKVLITTFGKVEPSVIEELSPSSAESGDRLGTSVVGVPLSRPEVVLAGAPGGNKLAAFFCTSLLAAGKGGVRCD